MNRDKMIQNERIIREHNRSAIRAIKKYFRGKKEIMDTPLDFICECSDTKCMEPVTVSIAEYERLHKLNNRFLIVKGHKTPQIENTVGKKSNMELVEKPEIPA